MSSNTSSADYGRFDELTEEFAARFRSGERPSLQEYIDRCPNLADEIRELFPALVEVERVEEAQPERPHSGAVPVAAAPLRQAGDYRILRDVGQAVTRMRSKPYRKPFGSIRIFQQAWPSWPWPITGWDNRIRPRSRALACARAFSNRAGRTMPRRST
jgi:hypothetical protein